MQSNFLDEKNPYVFVRNSAPNLYDKDGRLAGYIIVAMQRLLTNARSRRLIRRGETMGIPETDSNIAGSHAVYRRLAEMYLRNSQV